MASLRFDVEIVGPKPHEVPAVELAEFIQEFARAVLNASGGISESGGTPVSLVGVTEGSDRLTFATTEKFVPVVARISTSIAKRRFSGLPESAHESLHRMSQVTKRRGWGLRIPANKKLKIPAASIKKGADIPAPAPKPLMRGTTSLLARVMRVGGVRPRAELRIPNSSDLLFVDISEDIARILASRLYDEVTLEGVATWDPDTWRMRDFAVTRLLEFVGTPPAEAFRELSAAAGSAWDGVDAVAYVKDVREGGSDLH